MKILLLLLNTLCSFIYSPIYEEDDYDIIIEEKEMIENDYIKTSNNKTSF